jgi:hypothetical protein
MQSLGHWLTELDEVYARHAGRHGPNRLLPAEALPAHGRVPGYAAAGGPCTTTGRGRGWGYGRACARRRGPYASPRHRGKMVRGYLRDKGIRAGRDVIVELTARRRPLKQSKEVPHAANLKASAPERLEESFPSGSVDDA